MGNDVVVPSRTERRRVPTSSVAGVPPRVAGLALLAELVVHAGRILVVGRPRALAELVDVEVLLEVVEAVLEVLAAALGGALVDLGLATDAVGSGAWVSILSCWWWG